MVQVCTRKQCSNTVSFILVYSSDFGICTLYMMCWLLLNLEHYVKLEAGSFMLASLSSLGCFFFQIENEYGSYGNDKAYLRNLVTMARGHLGNDIIL